MVSQLPKMQCPRCGSDDLEVRVRILKGKPKWADDTTVFCNGCLQYTSLRRAEAAAAPKPKLYRVEQAINAQTHYVALIEAYTEDEAVSAAREDINNADSNDVSWSYSHTSMTVPEAVAYSAEEIPPEKVNEARAQEKRLQIALDPDAQIAKLTEKLKAAKQIIREVYEQAYAGTDADCGNRLIIVLPDGAWNLVRNAAFEAWSINDEHWDRKEPDFDKMTVDEMIVRAAAQREYESRAERNCESIPDYSDPIYHRKK